MNMDYYNMGYHNGYRDGFNKTKSEVKHGEWIEGWYGELSGTDAPLGYKCSLCSGEHTDPWEYCPNCGAEMKLTEEV
jgi:uncharacterized OB-fold protein